MEKRVLVLYLCMVCMGLFSCGPMEHKTYEYTISGYVYADRQTKKPLSGIGVVITDAQYSNTTYGESIDIKDYLVQTDEHGYFSLKLKSSKMHVDINTGWFYDTRGDSMLTDPALVAPNTRKAVI